MLLSCLPPFGETRRLSVRLWWNPSKLGSVKHLLLRADLVKKRAVWRILKLFPSLWPCQSMRGFFSNIYRENLVHNLKIKLINLWRLHYHQLPEFLTLTLIHFEPPVIRKLQFRFSSLGSVSWGAFSSWVSALVGCDFLDLPVDLPNLEGSDLPCDLTSLTDLRGVVDLSAFPGFYSLLGWSDNFQACSTRTCKSNAVSTIFWSSFS